MNNKIVKLYLEKLERKWRDFHYVSFNGNHNDPSKWTPGSPYDRGRWECADEIRELIDSLEDEDGTF